MTVTWQISPTLEQYEHAVSFMESRVAKIRAGEADEMIWLVEHPPLYTGGTSAKASDLIDKNHFPVFETGRGGEYTYHGPGQRVVYVMLDLEKRGAKDLRAYVKQLEAWIIATLARFDVEGFTREGRIGVWVRTPSGEQKLPRACESDNVSEKKIAALGIRVRKWVTYHGIALNVNPDLSHYSGIVPCGIREFGVTSLADLGIATPMAEVDAVLKEEFFKIFT